MENESNKPASGTADAATSVSCPGGSDCQLQQNELPETQPLINDQHADLSAPNDVLCTPRKKSSHGAQNVTPKTGGKSPQLRTPSKHLKHIPSKDLQKTNKLLFRTPKKSKDYRSRLLKRQHSRDNPTHEPSNKSRKLQDNQGSSSEIDLQDVVAAGNSEDINECLEQKATKVKMNAKNVKSVIHHVLTNEHVLNMFRDVLESEQEAVPGQSSPRKRAADTWDSLPKMTRAKVREFMEKISMPSPLKAAKDGPSFLDVEFNEEEDDDEYNPEKDEECHESDDESISSSKLSDFGSPYRDVTLTPIAAALEDTRVHSSIDKPRDIPSDLEMVSTSTGNIDSMLTIVTDPSCEEITDEVDTIALRTRSKLPLTSTTITEIESGFVAPDITTDMYYNNCDDADWAQFLSSLCKMTDDAITDDDTEANDPEFNYIAEAERELPDEEDYRFDKPTKISKKEMTALLSELNDDELLPYQVAASASEVTGSHIQIDGQDMPSSTTPFIEPKAPQNMPSTSAQFRELKTPSVMLISSSAPFSEFKTPLPPESLSRTKCNSFEPSKILQEPLKQPFQMTDSSNKRESNAQSIVTPKQRALIEDNMRKHIQLLLQSFLLCQNSTLLKQTSSEPKSLITELNFFRQTSPTSENSAFNVCNLDPALELVSDSTLLENSEAERSSGFGLNLGDEPRCMLSHAQKLAIYNSPAFIYPQLLPLLKKLKDSERKYSKFFASEDNLIALALEQLQDYKDMNPIEFMHKYLIRGKNIDQIFFRVQYMSSGRVCDNPIKCMKKTGKLPSNFPKPRLDNYYPVAPKDQLPDLLPIWCSSLKYSRAITSLSKSGAQSSLPVSTCQPKANIRPVEQVPRIQNNPEISFMSTEDPEEQMNDTQHTVLPQVQPAVNIPQVSQPITSQNFPAVQLPTNFPQITGIYIQFATPPSTPVTGLLPQKQLPILLPRPPVTSAFSSRTSNARGSKSIKRAAASSTAALNIKKHLVQTSDVIVLDEVSVNNTGTQTDECPSPDLLAKTMMSCGIDESPAYPSPQLHFPDLNQFDISFTSSTPVNPDKHPSVRNLNWEFDAADKQLLGSSLTSQSQESDRIAMVQPQAYPSFASGSLSSITRNETLALPEHRAIDMSSLQLDDLSARGKPLKEQAASFNDTIDCTLCTNSDAQRIVQNEIMTSSSDFDKHDLKSQSTISSYNTILTEDSEIRITDKVKQSPPAISLRNNQEHEVSKETELSSEFSSQNHLQIDVTSDTKSLSSPLENMGAIISEPTCSSFDHKHNETSETTLNLQRATSDTHSLSSPLENMETVISEPASSSFDHKDNETSEATLNLQLNHSDVNCLSQQEDEIHVDNNAGTNSKVDAAEVLQVEASIAVGSKDKALPCRALPKVDAAEVLQVEASIAVGSKDKALPCRALPKVDAAEVLQVEANIAVGSKDKALPCRALPKVDAAEVLQVEASIAVGSKDKALPCVSLSREILPDNDDYDMLTKPKTVRQILEAKRRKMAHKDQESSKTCSTPLECDIDSVILDTVNPDTDSANPIIENITVNKPDRDRSLIAESSDPPSVIEKQIDTSPSQGSIIPSPVNSFALIAIPSPAKSYESRHASPFKTPTKLRPLVAKALSPASSRSSPYVPLPKVSPKRKELNKHVRQILPKSFVLEIKSPSPTKAAAQVLKKKATMYCQNRSPVKLLPKQPQSASSGPARARPLLTPTRMFTRSQKTKVTNTEKKICEDIEMPAVKDLPTDKEKATVEPETTEAEDTGLSQEEEEEEFENEDQSQLDDLMAACTTIGYDPKKGSSGMDSDNKSKAQKKRDICLSMLEPDIIDRDPKKDERDTAYAQHYFTHVKQVLGDDPERFKKFLTILHDMNKNHMNPVELYADMATLLADHQDLVEDFAGFLLSYQAVECSCFVSCQEYQQILTFLRRLEIYCDTSNLTYQRTLKMMSRWLTLLNQESQADATPFKEKIAAILRHVPNIMDDLLSYFFATPLPDSHPDDFEEVNLVEDAVGDVDEFEEITLPESREDYNTKLCRCQCHQDQQDEKLRRRIKHCFSCSLKIFDGEPVLKTSRNEYRPITVLYPEEEKEKMMKAKKEAAQIALAKARAQRQQKKKKGKKRNVGNLKCKSSKNIHLRRKFKRRKICKSQTSLADAGSIQKSNCETENKNSDVRDGVDSLTQKREKSEKVASHKVNTTEGGKLTDASIDSTVSGASGKSVISPENCIGATKSPPPLKVNTVTHEIASARTHIPVETAALSPLQTTFVSEPTLGRKDFLTKSGTKNVKTQPNTEAIVSTLDTTCIPSDKSASVTSETRASSLDSPLTSNCFYTSTSNSASLASVTTTASLNSHLADSDVEVQTLPVSHNRQTHIRVSQSNISQPDHLSEPTLAVSSMSSGTSVSQANVLRTPDVFNSQHQVSTDIHNLRKTTKQSTSTVMSYQSPTHVSCGLQPRFATSPMLTTARIPVLVSISPQQYLPAAIPMLKAESCTFRMKSPHASVSSTSSSPSQELCSTKQVTDKYESYNQKMDSHHDIVSSDQNYVQQNLSNTSNSSLPFSTYAKDVDLCVVPQIDVDPVTNIPDSDAITSTSTEVSFTSAPSTSFHQTLGASISSSTSSVSAVDFQQSDTISNFPTTPVKGKVPSSVVRAHLDNFSLGAFEGSIGFHKLHQLAQSVSPNKIFADSVTKFDLLALIESSNLSCKGLTMQSDMAGSVPRSTTESLLTFSGALAKLKSISEEPTLTLSASEFLSENMSTQNKMEGLPISDDTSLHDETSFNYVTGDETNSSSISEVEEDLLKDICPQLTSSNVLMDDESSNAFELTMWTEEQDRTIIKVVTVDGVTRDTVKFLHSEIPEKSHEEISSRAKLLLKMLEDMGDTESDTGTETSYDDQSELDV